MAIMRMTFEADHGTRCQPQPEEEAEFRRRIGRHNRGGHPPHMIEDGEDPDEEPHFELVVLPQDVRKKLGMTQADFAALLRVPIGTLPQLGAEPLRHGASSTDPFEAYLSRTGGRTSRPAAAACRLIEQIAGTWRSRSHIQSSAYEVTTAQYEYCGR